MRDGAASPGADQAERAEAESGAHLLPGSVAFVEAGARHAACAELSARGALVVRLDAIAVTSRGRLGETVDRALERELAARGATGSGDLDALVTEALELGARGVAVALGSLRALIDAEGALDAADSRTVRRLARATKTAPILLLLDAADTTLAAYGAPVALASLVVPVARRSDEPPRPTLEAPPSASVPAPPSAPTVDEAVAALDATVTLVPAIAILSSDVQEASEEAVETTPRPALPVPPPEVWRPWVHALTLARGAQPLAAFERLFAQSYMPLARALERGLDEPRAREACDEFRRNFARAYTDACPTFAVTGKRPRMVFDAPDVALKIARLHGARATQLLLVDGLRFDLGLRVRDALTRELGARASLAEEHLLWSALPTTTMRQMDLLARGVDGLRNPGETNGEGEPMRGRTAETIRRVKIGHRDLFKLDLVQSRIADAATPRDLDDLVGAVTDAIARHAQTLSSRTLLFVFGDHGFARDRAGAITQGGASPEEVLVGGFAFLVGAVH